MNSIPLHLLLAGVAALLSLACVELKSIGKAD